MSIVFGVRGSLTARYSNGGATGLGLGNTAPTAASDAGALSGNSIQFPANNNIKSVTWPGRSNTPNARTISVLVRFRPNYSGTPAANKAIFSLTSGAARTACIEVIHNTSGNLIVFARNETATTAVNSTSAGAWSPTSGTWYDIVLTWDGTTTANSCKVYVDASLLGSGITPTAAFSASWTNQYFNEIVLGSGFNNPTNNADRFDEIIIWDTVIDPTAVTLDSGSGSLNGASRVSLVTVSAFDGASYSDPGVANVRSTTSYTYAGASQTGTLSVPTAANVKTGVAFESGGGTTGTYDGSDRHSDPGIANVLSGVQYKSNSTSNNRTGTLSASCDYPAITDVKAGTVYGSGTYTGTYECHSAVTENNWPPTDTQLAIYNTLTGDNLLADRLGAPFQRTLTLSSVPVSGSFKISWNGTETSALDYNVTAAQMQTALRLISALSEVTVTGSVSSGFTITLYGVVIVYTFVITSNTTGVTITVASVTPTQKIFDFVPQDTAFPYVVMQVKPWTDRGNATAEGFECVLSVHVWYQPGKGTTLGHGDYRIQRIQKRIDELIHSKPIAIAGWRNILLRRVLIDTLTDPDNVTKHGIQQFKLYLAEV